MIARFHLLAAGLPAPVWRHHSSAPEGYEVSLLAESETNELVRVSHQLPEWSVVEAAVPSFNKPSAAPGL